MTFQEATDWCAIQGIKVHMRSHDQAGSFLMILEGGQCEQQQVAVQDIDSWTQAFIETVEELQILSSRRPS